MPRSSQQIADYRAQLKESMAWAIAWREDRDAVLARLSTCARCDGAGLVWWSGKPGEGGKRGPCPKCQREGSQRFARQLAQERFA